MNKHRRLTTWFCILVLLFLLSGCTERPFLTKDGLYSFVTLSTEGEFQKKPIQLTWNSNLAVMQQLLLEASFVLGDLHTLSETLLSESIVHDKGDQEVVISSSEPKGIETEEELQEENQENLQIEEELLDKQYKTILLEATFPESKSFELMIDNKTTSLEISSIQIEVIGDHPSRVVLNDTFFLQGIENPNLKPAFAQFIEMLNKTRQVTSPGAKVE